MSTSWYQKAKEFKSPTYVVAAFLLRSRETQVATNRQLREEINELKTLLERQAQKKQRQSAEDQRVRRERFEAA